MEVKDIFSSMPEFETDRLLLRKLTLEDAEDIFSYASNDEVTKYVTWNTHKTLDDSIDYVKFALGQYENESLAPWGIELKETGKIIGTIDFVSRQTAHNTAEIGYAMSQDYWGKGIMTEAAKALVEFGFNKMELARIQAKCFVENIGSQRVMEKIGMSYEGTLRKSFFFKDKQWDLKVYSIVREDFDNGK